MKFQPLPLISCAAVLTGAIAAATAAPPSAPANPLRVAMYAASGASGGFSGLVDLEITNTSRHTVRVPRWELPSSSAESQLFSVSRDGEEVTYEGALFKRGLPQPSDFVMLRAGETWRSRIDLSQAYDLTQPGAYVVQFRSPLQYASLSTGAMLRQGNGLPMVAKSAPLQLWVQGGSAKKKPPSGGGGVVNGVTYRNCSSTQINGAGSAVVNARGYSENAKGYLASGTVGPRYTTWFGAYTSQRYSTASQHFVEIDRAMDQSGGQITIDCGCNQSAYAYVYPSRPYEIWVCRAFWNAPMTGTDSKAGTLIHEMSHFNVVAGTDDIVYGQSGAKNLAATDPNGALNNADNHEYFAENTPAQN